MKTVFILGGVVGTISLAGGCVAYDDPQDATGAEQGSSEADSTDGDTGTDSDGCAFGSCAEHELGGELMLIQNGRLASGDAGYQNNIPLDVEGTYLGPGLFLYDPLRDCADPPACRAVELGKLLLDDRLGDASVVDDSLRKFTLRDIAWHPNHGLWGISFDSKNDEWGIALLEVPAWERTGNAVPVQRWALLPGEPESPGTDPCYWQEGLSGLSFLGDDLLLGTRAIPGLGVPAIGMVYRVDLGVILSRGHCVYQNDVSQDPSYYACDVVCSEWAQFDDQIGIAGDTEVDRDGDGVLAVARSEDDAVMPRDHMVMFSIDPPDGGEVVAPVETGMSAEGFYPGLEIEGLARIEGRLFAVNTRGLVYEVDEDGQTLIEHEDLAPLFENFPDSVKIRGATRVVVE